MPDRVWNSESQDSFSGGITDYVDDAKINQSAIIENFIIGRDGGIEVRTGSGVWNLNALPNSLEALQLFQLEQYIFAYTDDGDVYWCSQDGSDNWTQIYTVADPNENYGQEYDTSGEGGLKLYIVPHESVQGYGVWTSIPGGIVITQVSDSDPNEITVTEHPETGTGGVVYAKLNLEYHTDSGSELFAWTSTLTAQLETGIDGFTWDVYLGDTLLNGTSHDDIMLSFPEIDLANDSSATKRYEPIYLYRKMPFVDSNYNGKLAVSKFNGHLYLALEPDDKTWTPHASDPSSLEPDIYMPDNYRVALRKIYINYDSLRLESYPRLTSAQMPPIKLYVEEYTVGANGAEADYDSTYIYEAYCRQTYEALVEGEPRTFIVDGPSVQASISWDVSTTTTPSVKVLAWMYPRALSDTELVPLNDIDIKFFRTTNNGSTFYNSRNIPAVYTLRAENMTGSRYNNTTDESGSTSPNDEAITDYWLSVGGLYYPYNLSNSIDTNSDAILLTLNPDEGPPYDSGGLLPYISIPQGPHYFTVANQIGYYCDVLKLRNRVYQSIYGIPHAIISTAFLEFDDGLIGIKTYRDNAFTFTNESLWRLEGVRGQTGAGSITQRLVSDEFGAISNASIIVTNYGLFFFSRTGICYSDGYKALRVSEQLFDTYYQWLEDISYIKGFYHESEQKVYWSVKVDGIPQWITLHLRYGISPETPITVSKGLNHTDIPALATEASTSVPRFETNVCLVNEYDKKILRHQSGMILQHDTSYTTDYDPVNDNNVPIIYSYKSRAFYAGTKAYRKWYANAVFMCKQYNNAGVSTQPLGYNDLSTTAKKLSPCFSYSKMQWGDTVQKWGNKDVSYNSSKIIKFRRKFSQGSIRATYKQFGITSLYVYGPDSYSNGSGTYSASVNSGAFRTYITIPIPLATAALDLEGATVDNSGAFAILLPGIWGAAWKTIHKVTDNTTSFDVYIDSDTSMTNNLTVNNCDWAIGYIRTGERIGLDHLTMKFTMIGEQTDGAYSNTDGGNEGDGALS